MSLEFTARLAARRLAAEFALRRGETVALLGPNGAGKSTVLSIIAGLLRPDAGRVALGGRLLTEVGSDVRATHVPTPARRIALLAQEPLLFPHLSVLDNVAFAPRCRRTPRAAARQQASHWLAQVGASELAGRRPSQISGGQAQRVAVARALAAEPELLLLDEPMAALDVAVTPAMRQTLKAVLRDRSVLLITHDVLDALLLADRVLVLQDGRIVEDGPTTNVLATPRSAFAARLAGLNLVPGHWRHGSVHTDTGLVIEGTLDGAQPPAGAAVVAVFRPGAVSVFLDAPGGSPRNWFRITVTAIEPFGDRIRVRAGDLAADITPRAVADLELRPGAQATFAVKATETSVYAT
ncbi:MAG: sulfate/molybdate ABC transporter ATP-binding protein [Nocardioides sp.]